MSKTVQSDAAVQRTSREEMKPTAVSRIIKEELFEEFDEEELAIRRLRGRSAMEKRESRWRGVPIEEIRRIWSEERDKAVEAGINLHRYLEIYYSHKLRELKQPKEASNESDKINEMLSNLELPKEEIRAIHEFINDRSKLTPVAIEGHVTDLELGITGTFDALFKINDSGSNTHDKYYLYEYKRVKELTMHNKYSRCLVPGLEWIENSNYWHLTIQMNFYKLSIEKKMNIKISGLRVVVFHKVDGRFIYEINKVPNMSKEIKKIVEWRRKRQSVLSNITNDSIF